jgi:hypothetical protein
LLPGLAESAAHVVEGGLFSRGIEDFFCFTVFH